MKTRGIRWKSLILHLLIPLAVGALSGLLTWDSMEIYHALKKPPLSPPSILFPIVWTALYLLMGIGAYMVQNSVSAKGRAPAMKAYAIQLAVNFLWPLLFFRMQEYLFAAICAVLLCVLIIRMMVYFFRVDYRAALLQFPYLIWSVFACYLNFGVYALNA